MASLRSAVRLLVLIALLTSFWLVTPGECRHQNLEDNLEETAEAGPLRQNADDDRDLERDLLAVVDDDDDDNDDDDDAASIKDLNERRWLRFRRGYRRPCGRLCRWRLEFLAWLRYRRQRLRNLFRRTRPRSRHGGKTHRKVLAKTLPRPVEIAPTKQPPTTTDGGVNFRRISVNLGDMADKGSPTTHTRRRRRRRRRG